MIKEFGLIGNGTSFLSIIVLKLIKPISVLNLPVFCFTLDFLF